ncbi:MAG: hydroxyethylthiazole kinase [Thioclava marina]|jgi:hydroxyethylthiazole kinase|uniref:hydroxyethylthiazole kinase n=1 Tax=Thioclava marina TaxID=1915077 RepID=UPI0019C8ADA9|nr:hydroxyethylthiazole kinase [Thioclava marina]MBC7146995.1 hydroxyethylthiazole kinase [Thioclava marina]
MEETGLCLDRMRTRAPLVHNITNFVAMEPAANVLLAIGAQPAMVHAREEVTEFAGLAEALNVNVGTPDPAWGAAMEAAAQVIQMAGKPWVLDPVGVGATRFRAGLCDRLLGLHPGVIRGNASEILALAGDPAQGRAIDSADPVEAAEHAARDLATRAGAVVAVSGPVDFVTDGQTAFRVANGHPMMTRVTALGCALNGVIAAFAVASPALEATLAALACYGLAGERAGAKAAGPGSFLPAFLDALHAITPKELTREARVLRA